MKILLTASLAIAGLSVFSVANATASERAVASLPSVVHVDEVDVHIGVHGGYRAHYHRHGRWVWRHHHRVYTHYY